MMNKKPNKHSEEWLEAKRRCQLSDDEIPMAKELGMGPRSLIKNIPVDTATNNRELLYTGRTRTLCPPGAVVCEAKRSNHVRAAESLVSCR